MEAKLKESILRRVADYPGHTSIYYQDLTTGEHWGYNELEPMGAASVIKLTVMAELFRQLEAGLVRRDQKITVRDEDRVPICGVLTLMHTGLEVTPIDLCWLMITISDNMATNLLIDLLGLDNIQANNRRLGLEGVALNRKLFETREAFCGKRNTVSARADLEASAGERKRQRRDAGDAAGPAVHQQNAAAAGRGRDRPQDRRGRGHHPRCGHRSGETSLPGVLLQLEAGAGHGGTAEHPDRRDHPGALRCQWRRAGADLRKGRELYGLCR